MIINHRLSCNKVFHSTGEDKEREKIEQQKNRIGKNAYTDECKPGINIVINE
jgi:hypothetical protein